MDIGEAVKQAITQDLDQYDFGAEVRSAVMDGMPYGELILRSIYGGVHDAVKEAIEQGTLTITVNA